MYNLRILGGFNRNQKIFFINHACRPITSRIRVNIFDILYSKVKDNYIFLDVFSGSGIMGIEALSRGASKSIFFEINKKLVIRLKKNLSRIKFEENKVHYVFCLNSLKPPLGSFADVIFLDPPYNNKFIINDVVKKLHKRQWVGNYTIIIIKIHMQDYKLISQSHLSVYKSKKIGKNMILFCHFKINKIVMYNKLNAYS